MMWNAALKLSITLEGDIEQCQIDPKLYSNRSITILVNGKQCAVQAGYCLPIWCPCYSIFAAKCSRTYLADMVIKPVSYWIYRE